MQLHPSVDTSVDEADVGVCATTSDTETQRCSSERNATTAPVAQVPRPAVSVLLPTPVSKLPQTQGPRSGRTCRSPTDPTICTSFRRPRPLVPTLPGRNIGFIVAAFSYSNFFTTGYLGGPFCPSLDVPQHPPVDAVDDFVRPQAPIRCRPHAVPVPSSALESRASARQRGEQELASVRH